jgi:hypothetical protein
LMKFDTSRILTIYYYYYNGFVGFPTCNNTITIIYQNRRIYEEYWNTIVKCITSVL